MRIGEIAIVGPHAPARREFIRGVSDEIAVQTDDLIFGRLRINKQLVVHLYGVNYDSRAASPSWDLVSQKLLGYVVLFNLHRPESYEEVQKLVDALSQVRNLPIVIAANVGGEGTSSPFQEAGISLAADCQFRFCDAGNPQSARKTLISLVDAAIEKIDT